MENTWPETCPSLKLHSESLKLRKTKQNINNMGKISRDPTTGILQRW